LSQDGYPVEREPAGMGAVDALGAALLATPAGRLLTAAEVLAQVDTLRSEQLVQEAAAALGIGLSDPVDVHVASVHAYSRFHFVSGTILSPLDNIATSGPARSAALRAIANTERANLGAFNDMLRGTARRRACSRTPSTRPSRIRNPRRGRRPSRPGHAAAGPR